MRRASNSIVTFKRIGLGIAIFIIVWPLLFFLIGALLFALFGEEGLLLVLALFLSFGGAWSATTSALSNFDKRQSKKELPPIVGLGTIANQSTYVTDQPIKPRTGEGFSSQMDGTSIRITYTDRMGTRTKRTITLNRLRYDQYGCSVIPTHIEAYCSLRQDRRTFFVRSIDGAFDGWNKINNLHSFLIQHARIPRGEAGSAAPSRTRAKLKKVLLDDPRIMVFCGYKNPDRKPTPYTLRLSSMKEATVSEEKDRVSVETTTIRTITGWDTEASQTRTVNYARIVSACDPDTGEIIEDLEVHLRSFRIKAGEG